MLIEKLEKNLAGRQSYLRADRNIHTVCLKEVDSHLLLVTAIPHIVKGIERHATLADLSVSVGRRIKQQLGHPKDTVSACQIGWFVLIAFFEEGILSYRTSIHVKKSGRKSKHSSYVVDVKDRKALLSLWTEVEGEEAADLYPLDSAPDPWVTGMHSTGVPMIKKVPYKQLNSLSPDRQPMLFSVLNRLASTPWRVNEAVLEVANYFLTTEDDLEGQPFKHKREKDSRKRESLTMVAEATLRLADKFRNRKLYHLYNCDFRVV